MKNSESTTGLKTAILNNLGVEVFPKAEHYYSVALLSQLAAQYGITVTEEDRVYWRSMLNVSRVVDDLVDEEGVTDLEPYVEQLIAGVPVGTIGEGSAAEIAAVYRSLDEDQQELLYAQVLTLPLYSRIQSEAASFNQYSGANRAEAAMYANIMGLPVVEGASDAAARSSFNQWLVQLSSAAYALDNFLDNRKDYEQGISPLKPGIRSQLLLAHTAIDEILRCAGMTSLSTLPVIANIQIRKHLAKLL